MGHPNIRHPERTSTLIEDFSLREYQLAGNDRGLVGEVVDSGGQVGQGPGSSGGAR